MFEHIKLSTEPGKKDPRVPQLLLTSKWLSQEISLIIHAEFSTLNKRFMASDRIMLLFVLYGTKKTKTSEVSSGSHGCWLSLSLSVVFSFFQHIWFLKAKALFSASFRNKGVFHTSTLLKQHHCYGSQPPALWSCLLSSNIEVCHLAHITSISD